jgi:hypothetical protein
MLEGMMRSALAAANMTPEEVRGKVDAIVKAAEQVSLATHRIEQRLIRLERAAGLEPLEFVQEEPEGETDEYSATGD